MSSRDAHLTASAKALFQFPGHVERHKPGEVVGVVIADEQDDDVPVIRLWGVRHRWL